MDAGPDGLTCLTFDGELMYDIFTSPLAMEKHSEKMLPRCQPNGGHCSILGFAILLGLNWRSCRG